MLCQSYYQPKTIQEAMQILGTFDGKARIIAGGTDLMIDLKSQRKRVTALVDISKVAGLSEIKVEGNHVCIGAGVTHTQVVKSSLILQWAPVLAEACSTIGSPQIRNMGTLVGNVVNAMPAADGACALIALGAIAKIINSDGSERLTPLEQLYKGPGESIVDSTKDMVSEVAFPISKGQTGSSFQRLSRRKALSLPVLSASVFIQLAENLESYEEIRIVLGPVAPVPFRAQKAETFLKRGFVEFEEIKKASLLASEEASPRTSMRAGSEYRQNMVTVLVERGVRRALTRIDPKFSNI